MPFVHKKDFAVYKERRDTLITAIKEAHPKNSNGIVVLFGGFEQDGYAFKQERSFYYLTGIEEPATALTLDLASGVSTLYVPNMGKERAKWVAITLEPTEENAQYYGVDAIVYLGNPCKGYQCHPFFSASEYEVLLLLLQKAVAQSRTIFTFNPSSAYGYVEQRFIVQRIGNLVPGLQELLHDISPLVAHMRRKKNNHEIELLYKAIDSTIHAHEVAARTIKEGKIEYEIQAIIEYMFTSSGCSLAFPSIVASGKNSTVLHYNLNNKILASGDLIVIDIGAEYNYYCADITRTYPVSGEFTKRQRELYDIVLDTQEYIESIAKPGMWLSNKEKSDQSLNHLAQEFLRSKSYDKYFPHGIGHFLGLDVHDVGDYNQPLALGDVITIEPGIYIPAEGNGIRIEDDYWLVKDGVVSLSENLPKHPDDIEKMVNAQEEDSQDYTDDEDAQA